MLLHKRTHQVHHIMLPICVLSVVLIFIGWNSRWIFTQQTDLSYLSNYYKQSQWVIPESSRVMSDNELYQYAGYQLVTGSQPFSINPETPPTAKYLYGFSLKLFGNPYIATALIFTASLVVFYLLLRIFNSSPVAILGTTLLAATPLFSYQLTRTMLDLPQLLFFLTHLFALLVWHKHLSADHQLDVKMDHQPDVKTDHQPDVKMDVKTDVKKWHRVHIWYLLVAGITLGLMASSKFPLFIPIIFALDAWFIGIRKHWKYWILLGVVTVATYLSTYTVFFLQGNSLFEWLHSQKWIVDFYFSSQSRSNFLMFPITAFTGLYKGWWGKAWQRADTWSILWPVTTATGLFTLFSKKRTLLTKQPSQLEFIAVLFGALCLAMAVIPFWPRYFLLVLPLGIILLLHLIHKKRILVWMLLGLTAVELFIFINQPPDNTLNFMTENWQQQQYQDMYQYFSRQTTSQLSIEEFTTRFRQLDEQLQLEERLVTSVDVSNNHDQQSYQFTIHDGTPLGQYQHQCVLQPLKEFGQWRFQWDWQCIAPDYQVGDQFKLIISPADQGQLLTENGVVLSQLGTTPFILLDKAQLSHQDQNVLFHQLFDLTQVSTIEIENLLYVKQVHQPVVEIGFVNPGYDLELFSQVKQNPAVIIENRPHRQYNQLFSRQLIPLLASFEKAWTQMLIGKNGGQLLLVGEDQQIKSILIQQPTINGSDVTVPYTLDNLRSLLKSQANQL